MTEALRFSGVSKAFGQYRVLDDFSLEIPLDGVTFVVGRSGIGKSVLCRLAVGLLRPDRGAVELLGEEVSRLPERELTRLRRRAPYLVQGPALLDWLTVEENVALAANGSRERVLAALARVGLAEYAHQFPQALGASLQKRVAIARALVLEPRLLLLDEPTTGLDRAAADQVLSVLAELRADRMAAIVVSHDYRAVTQLADRVLSLARGKPAFFGPTKDARQWMNDGWR